MKLSIVIVNWNTKELLRDCLNSVSLELDSILIEVIVVDNGSIDGSQEMVKQEFPSIYHIQNEDNVGFCKAVNQGIHVATGHYVLLLNSDTVANSSALLKTISFMESNSEIGIVGCRLTFPNGKFQSSCFRFPSLLGLITTSIGLCHLSRKNHLLNWDRYGFQEFEIPTEVDCIMGSFMMISKKLIQDIGSLDEGYFMFAEETDFCYRAAKANWKTFYFPDVSIIHNHSGSQKNWHDNAWAYGAKNRGVFLFLYKWENKLVLYAANIALLIGHLPKIMAWFISDVLTYKSGVSLFRRSLKVKMFAFHIRALFKPSLFMSPWRKE